MSPGTVALFIDGDNVSADFAEQVFRIISLKTTAVARVYGNAQLLPKWREIPGVLMIDAGKGKNATDLLMTIDVMEFARRDDLNTFVLVSSDADFRHLAIRLREKGKSVIGLGEPKTKAMLRRAFNDFHFIGNIPLNDRIKNVIKAGNTGGKGIPIQNLSIEMQKLGVKISDHGAKTWRAYLGAHSELFDLDKKGPDAHVRFIPAKPQGNN